MQPKDLLVHLEKGDRRLEMLRDFREGEIERPQDLNGLFGIAQAAAANQLLGTGWAWGSSSTTIPIEAGISEMVKKAREGRQWFR